MKFKELKKLAEQEGWNLYSIKGSHHKFKKNGKVVIIPNHGSRDIAIGTAHNILKKIGVKK